MTNKCTCKKYFRNTCLTVINRARYKLQKTTLQTQDLSKNKANVNGNILTLFQSHWGLTRTLKLGQNTVYIHLVFI